MRTNWLSDMMKTVFASLIIASFLVLGQSSSYARKRLMTQDEFTSFVLSALQKNFPKMTFQVTKPLSINGKDKKGRAAMIFLGNSYPVYVSDVSSTQKIVEGHISALRLQLQPNSVVALKNILPVLKPKDYFDNIAKQLAGQTKVSADLPLVYKKINDDLYQLFVFDTPKSMRFVMKEDLKTLKLKEDELEQVAAKNLIAYFKKSRAHFRKIPRQDKGVIYYFAAKETYEASALFLLDKPAWNGQKIEVKGRRVIFVPARNVLLIAGSDDPIGLKEAALMAQNFYKNYGYGISPHGMIKNGATWQRFKP